MRIRLAVLGLAAATFVGCGGQHALSPTPSPTDPSPSVTITVSPTSAQLMAGGSAQFSAAITGTSNTAVAWTATGGTIAGNGMFTAGSTAGNFSVTATSAADSQASASARVTITDATPPTAVTVTISPASATVTAGATQQFAATVSGASDTAVTWSATGGTIVASGLFTAGAQAGPATVTAASAADTQATATARVTVTAAAAGAPPPPPRLFTSPSADWLYRPPSGQGIDISSTAVKLGFSLNDVDAFGYPVQYTDGTHGCTTFTDTLVYRYGDKICVPNPPDGLWWPTQGGWGSNDGHLVMVNTETGDYYDFWKLYTDGHGHITGTNVGKIVTGNLATSDGTPGTTAADITGLAGDILPGELDCEDCMQHALNVIVPAAMNSPQLGGQGPVRIGDGSVPGGIFREGAKIRFDPSVDVDSLPASTAVKAVMKALQKYGGLITDQTGANAICFYTALAHNPDLTGNRLILEHLLIYY